MKKIRKISTALLLSTLSLPAVSAVVVYKDSHYEGSSSYITAGNSYSATKEQLGMHDSISSLTVGPGNCAILLEHAGFHGSALFFPQGSYSDLRDYDFNDKTSSLHVINSYTCNESDLTRIYRDSNYSNKSIAVPIGFSAQVLNLKDGWKPHYFAYDFNDDFSSVKLGDNACLVAHKHANFSGTTKEFISNVASFSSYGFNDTISSLSVVPASECTNPVSEVGGGGGGGNSCEYGCQIH